MAVDTEMQKNIIKMIRAKKYTHDPQIIAALDQVATNQEELEELLAADVSPIYLCGESFDVPEHKQYLQITPVNQALINRIDTLNYDNVEIPEYIPSPLKRIFASDLGGMPNQDLYTAIMAGIQDYNFDKHKSTSELYLTIINSDLPILR